MSRSPEKTQKSLETLSQRHFDINSVKVSERFSSHPTFSLEEREADDTHPMMMGVGITQSNHMRYKNLLDGDSLMRRADLGADSIARGVEMTYEIAAASALRSESEVLDRPATFVIDKEGNLIWSADDKKDSIGLVLVRADGRADQLGTDKDVKSGIVSDLSGEDEVYMLPNELISVMKVTRSFARSGFETIMEDSAISADVVRVTFDEAITYEESTKASQQGDTSAAEQRRDEKRIRDERRAKEFSDRLASLDDNDVVSPVDVMEAFANDQELQSQIDAAQGSTGSNVSDGLSLGFRDMMRVAGSVEKHTDKVAKYEELAATALAKRMKGRLFKPLRRKTQEADVAFDDTMRMLDRFTMALDNSLMKQMLLEGKTDEEATELLAEHQQMRAEARAEKNRAEFTKGKVASWLDKYANLPTKKKILFGLGASAVIATAGAGLAVAGGAFVVAGGVGLAVAKVGKTYAQKRSEIYRTDANEVLSPNISLLDEDGNVTKRSVREQVIAAKDHNQVQREKAIKKADRNKKIAAGLATISAVAIGAGAAMKVIEHSDDIQKFWNRPLPAKIPTEVGTADGSWVTESPVVEPAPAPAPFEFSADASTVTDGEGWYQTIQETTGVTDPGQQAAILQKIGPALQEKGWAYPMSDGTWGISRPGALPKDVLELIKNSR